MSDYQDLPFGPLLRECLDNYVLTKIRSVDAFDVADTRNSARCFGN
jgi:hypothetical protein